MFFIQIKNKEKKEIKKQQRRSKICREDEIIWNN